MLLSISARSFAPPAQEYAVDVLEEGSDVSPQKAQVGIGLQSPRDSIWIVWTIPPSGVLAKGLDMSSGRRIRETRLKLHQIEFVVAIYERRSIAAAALALNISQPAATRMLKEIESILGVKLFERTRLGVTPTPYGDAMIRRARLILSETRLLHDEIAALANGVEGRNRGRHLACSIGDAAATQYRAPPSTLSEGVCSYSRRHVRCAGSHAENKRSRHFAWTSAASCG